LSLSRGICRRVCGIALAGWLCLGGAALAHDAGLSADAPAQAATATPFPIDLRPAFSLIDHQGRPRSQVDFEGRPMLVFFGYAGCKSMCDVALPRMADALDQLGASGLDIAPLFITVDPAHDTAPVMAKAVARHHAAIIGLTGDARALRTARESFQVEANAVGTAADGGPIFAHGTMIYLIDRQGRLATIMPPVLDGAAIAAIVRRYIAAPS